MKCATLPIVDVLEARGQPSPGDATITGTSFINHRRGMDSNHTLDGAAGNDKHGVDHIKLSAAVFTALGERPSVDYGVTGLYDAAIGNVGYGADGVGGSADIVLAVLGNKPPVFDAADFVVMQ